MTAIFMCCLIVAAFTGAVLRLFERLGLRFGSACEEFVFAAAAGLGLLAQLVLALGTAGLLNRTFWAVLTGALFVLFVKKFSGVFRNACGEAGKSIGELAVWERIPFFIFLIAAVFVLSGTLAPAIGQDELCYHLNHPKYYVQAHSVFEVPYATNSLWPYSMEMLFTLGLLLKGVELAKLFHFVMYLLVSGAIYSFLRRVADARTACLGFLIYALMPGAFIQAAFAYNENALACYSFLSFYSAFLYHTERRRQWIVLAGVFAGLAAATKLTGLFLLPIAAVFFLADLVKYPKKKEAMAGFLCFSAAAALSGGIWYLRAALLRGNPLFPFYPQFFGGHGWQDPSYVGVHGRGRDALSFLLFLWDTAMHPSWFGGESIGVLYLIFLPAILLLRPLPAYAKFMLCAGLSFALLWHCTDPNMRFLFPALAVLSVPAAFSLNGLSRGISMASNRAVGVLALLLFAGQASFATYHFKDEMRLVFSRDTEHYLEDKERTYSASRQMQEYFKPGDKMLSVNEARGYYFAAPVTAESDFRRFTSYASGAPTDAQIISFLKKEGFTHILKHDGEPPEFEIDGVQRLLADPASRQQFLKQEIIVRDRDARYSLYRIL